MMGSTLKCWSHKLVPSVEFNPRVDNFLESIVIRSLKLDPTERYLNAMEMLKDLMHWEPPKSKHLTKSKGSIYSTKSTYNPGLESKEINAQKMVEEAINLSRDASKLMEAADLLEEAITKQVNLKEKYEYQLKLWRRGIAI